MRLHRWLGSEHRLARNTASVMAGNALRVGVQAVYFVIIARTLGAQGYGAFVGVVAMVAIAAPFASVGSGNLLIKAVAREPGTFGVWWGRALRTTLVSGGTLVLLVALGATVALPRAVPIGLVLSVAVADLLFSRALDLSAQAYQAFERLDRTAQLQFLLSPLRLAGALILSTVVAAPTAESWGLLYLASSAVAGTAGVVLASRELGRPLARGSTAPMAWREGFYFSVSLSAQGINNDIDKTLLARLSSLQSVGIYGAAYRLIDLTFVPVRSLLYAAYARFFQHGVDGIRSTVAFARRLLPVGAGYSVVAGVIIFAAAPIVPLVLGADYHDSVEALRWLAALPLLRTIQYFGADALTGAGFQGSRTLGQLGIAALNILLCLWLLPLYSWRGAAWASLASDGALAVTMWGLVWHTCTRERERLSQRVWAPAAGGST